MDWKKQVAEVIWLLVTIGFMFGPAIAIYYRHLRGKESSREALVGALAWVSVVLGYVWLTKSVLYDDHKEACRLLEKELVRDTEDPDEVELPFECYKYSEEYADLASEMDDRDQ